MPEMHSLLAVERQVKDKVKAIFSETMKVFSKGSQLTGETKSYSPFDDEGEPLPTKQTEVVTTVPEKLGWLWEHFPELIDLELQRDTTNTQAKNMIAELVPDALPATFLLSLEKRIDEIRNVYLNIPTLDLAVEWKESERDHVYKHGPNKSYKTTKQTAGVVLYEATDKHPAQVERVTKDVSVGTYTHTLFSGAVHPKQKAKWLSRIDELSKMVKRARQAANKQELVKGVKIGDAIRFFIHKGDE